MFFKHVIEIRKRLDGNDEEWIRWEGKKLPKRIIKLIKEVGLENVFVIAPHLPEDLSCKICNTIHQLKEDQNDN